MISTKKLVEMAKKWRKMAARGRKRISLGGLQKSNSKRNTAEVLQKGYFAFYAAEGKRYMVPLAYLRRPIFLELLKMAEEEFGLSISGAITFPCDSQVLDYIMSLLCRDMSSQTENALLVSLSSCRCLSSCDLPRRHPFQIIPLQGF